MSLKKIEPRKGNTALHSSFQHLVSKHSKWDTILVGWTGKINPIAKTKVTAVSSPTNTGGLKSPGVGPQSPRTAGSPKSPMPGILRRQTTFYSHLGSRPVEEVLKITGPDRKALEQMLLDRSNVSGGYGKSVPVWLGDEEDGGVDDLTVGEDWERWGMLSQKGRAFPNTVDNCIRLTCWISSFVAVIALYSAYSDRWGIRATMVERLQTIQSCLCG